MLTLSHRRIVSVKYARLSTQILRMGGELRSISIAPIRAWRGVA
ncbi:MAG: hypothetical protein Ct9H300mP8_12810 [Gammaproteobacteria bacterium]|nr:MAG: hypothetical protein Ct9H300mP8_12810 [Gammaproteobacteria bacterium]